MKSIKRTRCDSHKKKKVTAAQVKTENSRRRKQTNVKKKQKTVPPPIIIENNDIVIEVDGAVINNINDAINNAAISTDGINNNTITNHTITNDTITNNTITNHTITDDTITNRTITDDTITNDTITDDTTTDDTITNDTITNDTTTNDTTTNDTTTNDTVINANMIADDANINFSANVLDAVGTVDIDQPVATDCNLPKQKAKSFISISKDRIQMMFRLGVENYSNMVPQISKEIISNFSYKYKRRCTNLRRTGRIISTTPIPSPRSGIDGISVSNYSRCYVEDYMTRKVGETLLVLLPSRYGDDNFSEWFSLMSSDICYVDITFTKHKYRGYIGIVTTNPILSRVQNGMHRSDYDVGFGNHNYGCNVMFQGHTNFITFLSIRVTIRDRHGSLIKHSGDVYRKMVVFPSFLGWRSLFFSWSTKCFCFTESSWYANIGP